METISNVASTAATTVSNLIYGQPAENETAGEEPRSGEQGKGTANDPFDRGNANATKPDEFLKLNPVLGTSAVTSSTSDTKSSAPNHTAMPVIPLHPDAATSNAGKTGAVNDDTTWKPTALDEVKPSGAPGAGPAAPPDVKTAVPEGYQGTSSSNKETAVGDKADASKDPVAGDKVDSSKDPTAPHGSQKVSEDKKSAPPALGTVLEPTPKKEHSLPDDEVYNPHSKMQKGTLRSPEQSKPDKAGETKVVESNSDKSESKQPENKQSASSKEPESSSPGGAEEKDGKMSHLKEKLKSKLHIGSKDE